MLLLVTTGGVVMPQAREPVRVDVYVLGARGQRAQVVGEVFEWAGVVGAKDRDDVWEARRCPVPFCLGRVVAGTVEDHAEAARRACFLCHTTYTLHVGFCPVIGASSIG